MFFFSPPFSDFSIGMSNTEKSGVNKIRSGVYRLTSKLTFKQQILLIDMKIKSQT